MNILLSCKVEYWKCSICSIVCIVFKTFSNNMIPLVLNLCCFCLKLAINFPSIIRLWKWLPINYFQAQRVWYTGDIEFLCLTIIIFMANIQNFFVSLFLNFMISPFSFRNVICTRKVGSFSKREFLKIFGHLLPKKSDILYFTVTATYTARLRLCDQRLIALWHGLVNVVSLSF